MRIQRRFTLAAVGIAASLFVVMLLCIEGGRQLGELQLEQRGAEARTGATNGDSVVYALLALLIGFTFNGAAARFDHRRQLVMQQVNATDTAWQRIDALPSEEQERIRTGFRRYVDAVLTADGDLGPRGDPLQMPPKVALAQQEVWTQSMAACLVPSGEKARMLLLPALNELFGAVDKERLARRVHPPLMIFAMLGLAELAGAVFVGYGMATAPTRNWIFIIGVAATIALATYVIVDLEYPRLGFIRMNAMDRALGELRATMQ